MFASQTSSYSTGSNILGVCRRYETCLSFGDSPHIRYIEDFTFSDRTRLQTEAEFKKREGTERAVDYEFKVYKGAYYCEHDWHCLIRIQVSAMDSPADRTKHTKRSWKGMKGLLNRVPTGSRRRSSNLLY